ncbi:MAG: ATP-binding cassette domain-containing protein, partial [Owenweeksia sp.]
TDSMSHLENFRGRVEFRDISFSYPTRLDQQVLYDISFTAEPGEQVALVGPSGAGKSTVVSLLLRFYNPSSGIISFDGKNATEYSLSEI